MARRSECVWHASGRMRRCDIMRVNLLVLACLHATLLGVCVYAYDCVCWRMCASVRAGDDATTITAELPQKIIIMLGMRCVAIGGRGSGGFG